MKSLLAVALALALSACQTLPDLPDTITVVEKEFQPIDSTFTDVVEKPQPTDGSVGARVISHDKRGQLIDLWACHRRLLARLSAGEKVDMKECDS